MAAASGPADQMRMETLEPASYQVLLCRNEAVDMLRLDEREARQNADIRSVMSTMKSSFNGVVQRDQSPGRRAASSGQSSRYDRSTSLAPTHSVPGLSGGLAAHMPVPMQIPVLGCRFECLSSRFG